MTDSSAHIGYGASMAVKATGDADFIELGEVTSITPPSDKIDTVDVTHMKSPNATREFVGGLIDPGEASFELNFVPGSTSDTKIQAIKAARQKVSWRVTFPIIAPAVAGVTWTFSGLITGYETDIPLDDKMTGTVSIKVSGSVVTGVAA